MTGRRTTSILMTAALAAGSLSVGMTALAPAASASPAASSWTGSTGILINKGVSQRFLRNGVAIIGGDPAGGTQIASGKLAFEMPVKSVGRPNNSKVIVQHFGTLTFTVGDGYEQRSVVLRDVTLRLNSNDRDRITAEVTLDEASADGGSREFLGTMTVFTLKLRPTGPSSFPYSIYVSDELASAASAHLGWFPAGSSRLGAGFTDLIPPK